MSNSPQSPGSQPSGTGHGTDPLAPLGALPGVSEAVESVRGSVDLLYRHRIMRRRSAEVTAEAVLRGARASAALAGADWELEEVRRRSDFSVDEQSHTVGAALRVTAEAGQLLPIWRQSPLRVLARLHLVAAGGTVHSKVSHGAEARAETDSIGRPRLPGEPVHESTITWEPPSADEVSARLEALAELIVAGSSAPALVTAAVVHGELLVLRPFGSYNTLIARAAERIVLVGSGLDPKSICPAEVGHVEAETESGGYLAALEGYVSGTPEGMARWIAHCGRSVRLGARESTAVCEAMQRGAA